MFNVSFNTELLVWVPDLIGQMFAIIKIWKVRNVTFTPDTVLLGTGLADLSIC